MPRPEAQQRARSAGRTPWPGWLARTWMHRRARPAARRVRAERQIGERHGESDGRDDDAERHTRRKLRARSPGIARRSAESGPSQRRARASRRRTETARRRHERQADRHSQTGAARPRSAGAARRRARTCWPPGMTIEPVTQRTIRLRARSPRDAGRARTVPALVDVEALGPGLERTPEQQVHPHGRREQDAEGRGAVWSLRPDASRPAPDSCRGPAACSAPDRRR